MVKKEWTIGRSGADQRRNNPLLATAEGVDFRTTQEYLGHKDPKHTARYTRVAARRWISVEGHCYA